MRERNLPQLLAILLVLVPLPGVAQTRVRADVGRSAIRSCPNFSPSTRHQQNGDRGRAARARSEGKFPIDVTTCISAHGLATQKDASELSAADKLAYRHLLSAMASSDQLSPRQQKDVRIRIAKIGLSAEDAEYLELTLLNIGVRDELARIAREKESLKTAAAQQSQIAIDGLRSLEMQEDDLMRYAKAQVIRGLSPEGAALLDKYVKETVKAQIKIIYSEAMAPN